jgi:outer membrane protein
MKTNFFIAAAALVLLQSVSAQESLTVEQAVQQVLQNHPEVVQANQNVRASEARVLQTKSATLPDIAMDALYTRIGPVPQFSFPEFGTFKLFPENNYDAHIGGRYTLYDFGKEKAAVALGNSQVQTASDAVQLTKFRLAYQTIRIFYAILFLQQSVQVADEQVSALNQHLLIAKKKKDAGTATSFDVLTTQVRVAAAQNQKIELDNALQKQQAVLRQLLVLPTEAPLRLEGEFLPTSIALNTDSLVQAAFDQRAEITLAHDAEKSAELQHKFASTGKMPSLRMNVSWGVKNGYIPNLDVLRGNWVAGVQMQLPVFDGNRIDHQEEEATAAFLAAQAHTEDVEHQIRSEVEQAIADVHAAISTIQISDLQVQQAREAVSIARTRYETGSVTNLDLLDAETAESSAKLAQLQALFKYVISRYELKQAVGSRWF